MPSTYLRYQTTCGPVPVVEPRSPLSTLIVRPAIVVRDSCTLAEAVEMMRAGQVSLLLVAGHVGVVTERDLARALAGGSAPDDPIGPAVDPHPRVVPATTTVVAAAALMLNEQLGSLVVDLGNGGLGVVFAHDVMAVLLQVADPDLWLTSLKTGIDPPTEIWLG
jgi:CBS domain-containing protein